MLKLHVKRGKMNLFALVLFPSCLRLFILLSIHVFIKRLLIDWLIDLGHTINVKRDQFWTPVYTIIFI